MMSGSLSSRFIDVTNPMLRVFDAQEKDNSIIEYEYIQRFCQDGSNISNIAKPMYEIYLTDRDQWQNLSEAFVEARFQIIAAQAGQVATGNIALENGAENLFKRVECQFDGKTLVEARDYPGWVNQITGLVSNSPDSEKQLTNELWYPDRYNYLNPVGASSQTLQNLASLTFINAGVIDGGNLVASSARSGQKLQITGTGANPHVLAAIAYPGSGSVAPNNGDLVQILYNGQPVRIRVASTFFDYFVVSAAGLGSYFRSGAVAVAAANADVIRLFLGNTNELFLYSNTGNVPRALTFSANGTPAVTAADGDGNAMVVPDTLPLGLNPGFLERKNKFIDSATGLSNKVVTCWIPLRKLFGFFDYNRIIMKGMVTKFSFYVNDDTRALIRDNTAVDGKIKFWALNLWVPYVVPKRTISDMLNVKLLENTEVAMGFYDYKYLQYPQLLAAGPANAIQWVVQQDTTKPVRVYAFFQNANATSSQTISTMTFGKAAVQTARCIINSNVMYPKEEYNIDFTTNTTNNNVTRAYIEYLRSGGKAFTTSTGADISIDEFANLYQVFTFDLTKQDDERIYEYTGTNTIQLRFTFNGNHPVDFNLYCYVVNERVATLRGMQGKLDILSS